MTPAELHELGYDLIVSPLTALFAAARAMGEALAVLREQGTLRDQTGGLLTFDEFNEIVELDRHYQTEAAYAAPAAD